MIRQSVYNINTYELDSLCVYGMEILAKIRVTTQTIHIYMLNKIRVPILNYEILSICSQAEDPDIGAQKAHWEAHGLGQRLP